MATTQGLGRVKVEGARELRRTLKQAGDDLSDLKSAHMDVASIVVPAAQGRAPHRSGALAGTIRPGATKTAAIVRAGSRRVPYAGVQEWGWGRRNISAQPYLGPAARATEVVWVAVYESRIDRILSKVKGTTTHG